MSLSRTRFTKALVAAFAVLSMSIPAAQASGATAGDAATVAGVAGGRHCVQQANTVADQAVHPEVCFASYAASVSYLTGGRVGLASTATFKGTTPELQGRINAGALGALATYILSIEYEDSSFGGATKTFTAAVDCTGTVIPYVSTMPSGWNNKISSVQVFSGCGAKHYDNTGATNTFIPAGASLTCTTTCSSLGAMGDATSSMRWT